MLQQLLNAVTLGSVFALFAVGLSLAWGSLDVLNLAHGSFFVAGAWSGYELTSRVDAPFILVVLLGVIAGVIVALVLDLVAFRPIRERIHNKRQAELSMLAATVGAGLVADSIIGHATGDQVFSLGSSVFDVKTYNLLGLHVSNIQLTIIGVSVIVTMLLSAWVSRSRQGIAIRAIAFSPTIPSLHGVNVSRVAAGTMAISGALAGLAGVLLCVWVSGMDVSTGHSYLLKGFAVVVVGGVGSIKGSLVAAFLVAGAETAVAAYGPASFRDAVAFALIILILLARPQGLFGRRQVVRA